MYNNNNFQKTTVRSRDVPLVFLYSGVRDQSGSFEVIESSSLLESFSQSERLYAIISVGLLDGLDFFVASVTIISK